jgi:pyruvate/2-oxoglutarate dehydrogenase complex dihydrolipoamide acyltransferase (E2) component
MFGTIFNTPIIVQPQTAILGVGAIKKKPAVVNDEIAIRLLMYLALSYDHRVIDGLPAIRFLQRIRELLEGPRVLLPAQ